MERRTLPPFAGWSGPYAPRLLIIGEAWGEDEAQTHKAFVGTSGKLLWEMLGQALPDTAPEMHSKSLWESYRLGNAWIRNRERWLEEAGISYTNVLNFRPNANNLESLCSPKKDLPNNYDYPALTKGKYLRPEYLPELARLLVEIERARPNCILAAGNSACWALLHATNIGAIRGSVTLSVTDPQTKVVPCYHPAAILRQWQWRPVTIADIIKASREAEFKELIRPHRRVIINPSLYDIVQWYNSLMSGPSDPLAVDTETIWGQVSCIGFARSRSDALVIPLVDKSKPGASYWHHPEEETVVWNIIKSILTSDIPKLFQNGMYDLQYIIKMGIKPRNLAEDTMLLHHAMFPEMRKGLGFLASIYSNEAAWKLMGRPKADTVKRDE